VVHTGGVQHRLVGACVVWGEEGEGGGEVGGGPPRVGGAGVGGGGGGGGGGVGGGVAVVRHRGRDSVGETQWERLSGRDSVGETQWEPQWGSMEERWTAAGVEASSRRLSTLACCTLYAACRFR
jgi:hypothetical protein